MVPNSMAENKNIDRELAVYFDFGNRSYKNRYYKTRKINGK